VCIAAAGIISVYTSSTPLVPNVLQRRHHRFLKCELSRD
jgi:hypothetical protein